MAEKFQTQALIFAVILVVYILTAHLIEVKKIPFLHQSAVSIVLGMLTAIFVKYTFGLAIVFSNQIFFAIILPPIIFSAGYSLRKSLFFQNLGIISFLGVVGTIIGFVCLSAVLGLLNKYIFQALTFGQVLLLSSVLCATDTVAAMALIKPQKYPVLNAVLFGEGIINDAVSIILFRTVYEMKIGTENSFTFETVMIMMLKFLYLLFFSLALGVASGFGLSYLFKVNISFTKHPIKETSLILLNGYITYLVGEELQLSGIISLFTCAVIMGHYCFLNISEEAQRATGLVFETVSYIAQAFIFAYLGASILGIDGEWLAVGFALMILLSFPFIRALVVYMLPFIYYVRRKVFPMNPQETQIVWYSGMVRGVIAFALCLQIKSENPNPEQRVRTEQFVRTITIVIVMVTTFLGAIMLKAFAKFIKLPGSEESQDEQQSEEQAGRYQRMKQDTEAQAKMSQMVSISSNYNDINLLQEKREVHSSDESHRSQKFQSFESNYIKPLFQKQKVSYELEDENNNKEDKKGQSSSFGPINEDL